MIIFSCDNKEFFLKSRLYVLLSKTFLEPRRKKETITVLYSFLLRVDHMSLTA